MSTDDQGHQNPEPVDIDLPDVEAPVVKHHEVQDAFNYDVAFKMAFVGIGQGGGRIAETFYKQGYRRVVAINSAMEDLQGSRRVDRQARHGHGRRWAGHGCRPSLHREP